jgi:hypothetical protein
VSDRIAALVLLAGLLALYNANGREIGNYDSQPTKYAARELLLRGTLTLNYVVGATPQLRERPAFLAARDGRYRSAYSPVPAIAAAAICWPLWKTGIIDIRAPLGANLIAKLSASLLTAAAVTIAFFTARRYASTHRALFIAAALGAGTGYWSTTSQTLWQHETTAFGLSLAVFAFTAPGVGIGPLAVAASGLALAGTSRPQLAPAVAVLLLGILIRGGWRRAILPIVIVAAAAGALMTVHLQWFGSVLGGMPSLEALHPRVHATETTFNVNGDGFAGLWLAPNRGLLIFSPIVLGAVAGIRYAFQGDWRGPTRWCALAALAQYVLYGAYAVWWGGHTYGPRYMLDVLPFLVPLAAAAGARRLSRSAIAALWVALAWSVAVAALGAFVFPHERWNLMPEDVDRHHERLWDWSDTQILRASYAGGSHQNFSLTPFSGDR